MAAENCIHIDVCVKVRIAKRKMCLITDEDLRHAASARHLHPFLAGGSAALYIFHGSTRLRALHAFFTSCASQVFESRGRSVFPRKNKFSASIGIKHSVLTRGVMALFGSSIAIVFIVVVAYAAAGPVQVKHTLRSCVTIVTLIIFFYFYKNLHFIVK